MINTGVNQASATIYQFPAGGRAALRGRRYDAGGSATDLAASANVADCCDSWYHQAAIDESKPARDH